MTKTLTPERREADKAAKDRDASILERFAAQAKAGTAANEKIIEGARLVREGYAEWITLYGGSQSLNEERYGRQYRLSGMPRPEHLGAGDRWAKAVILNGLDLPLPSDLPAHVYEGKAREPK